jgi:hypothetical protein
LIVSLYRTLLYVLVGLEGQRIGGSKLILICAADISWVSFPLPYSFPSTTLTFACFWLFAIGRTDQDHRIATYSLSNAKYDVYLLIRFWFWLHEIVGAGRHGRVARAMERDHPIWAFLNIDGQPMCLFNQMRSLSVPFTILLVQQPEFMQGRVAHRSPRLDHTLDSFDLATPEFSIGRGVFPCPIDAVHSSTHLILSSQAGRDEEQSDLELSSQCLGIRPFLALSLSFRFKEHWPFRVACCIFLNQRSIVK